MTIAHNKSFNGSCTYIVFINLFTLCRIYVVWIATHYIATHLYTYVCAPKSVIGFIVSPFMVISPQCKAIYWMLNFSITSINHMWVVFGIWCGTKIKEFAKHDK